MITEIEKQKYPLGMELLIKHAHKFDIKKTMRFHHPKMVQGLVDWCKLIPAGSRGIEIGCFAGESALILLESIPNLELICVDPWLPDYYSANQIPTAEKSFDAVIKPYQDHLQELKDSDVIGYIPDKYKDYHEIYKIKKTSDEAFKEFIESGMKWNFVYIDGNHKYEFVKRDIQNALKIIKPGGILGGHDYKFKGSPGVIAALLEVMGREADYQFPDYSFAYRV